MSNEAFDLFLKLAILNKHFIALVIGLVQSKVLKKYYITSSMLITGGLFLMREMAGGITSDNYTVHFH